MKNNFVALDFETSFGKTPCSIGVVEFVEGRPTTEFYSLIKPYDLKFSPINSKIHGITLDQVINEKEFHEIWDDISNLFENRVVVCHNSAFDLAVLSHVLELSGISAPRYTSYCTYQMSRKYLNLESYKLPNVAAHYGLINNDHHNALQDALLCGQLFYLLCTDYKLESETVTQGELNPKRKYVPLHTSLSPNKETYNWKSSAKLLDLNFVVSGVFNRFSREDIIRAIDDNGGVIKTSVTAKVDYIIAGDNMGPAKLEKATQLGVAIISEDEFIQMIS